MQIRYLAGVIISDKASGAAITRGRAVKLDANGKWIHCSVAGEQAGGIALQDHRVISTGFNIYNSSYDEGLASVYNGRRNPYKVSYDNVGQPLAVLVGKGNVIEEIPNTAFTGNLAVNGLLKTTTSGVLQAHGGTGQALAQVLVPANSAVAGQKLGIITL